MAEPLGVDAGPDQDKEPSGQRRAPRPADRSRSRDTIDQGVEAEDEVVAEKELSDAELDRIAGRGAKRLFVTDVAKRTCLILYDRIMVDEQDRKRGTSAKGKRGAEGEASSPRAEVRPARKPSACG